MSLAASDSTNRRRKRKNVVAGYVNTTEASRLLSIDVSLVTRYCRQNRLKGAVCIGKLWLIPEAEIEKFQLEPRQPGNPNLIKYGRLMTRIATTNSRRSTTRRLPPVTLSTA